MPLAWRLREPVTDVDVVVSSSHACAKAVRIAPGIPHLCYCHTPMRYAWHLESESGRFPRALRAAARVAAHGVRAWDRRTAANVTRFVANSHAVAERIRRFYGRDAAVIHPPVRTDFFTPDGTLERDETFLFVGRLVSYKRPDLLVDAFSELPYRLTVVGAGHLRDELVRRATPNVSFVEHVDDERLRDLYRSAHALVVPGEEDFGIITAEALASGTPVVAFGRGGSADIVEDGVSGWLYDGNDVNGLRAAIRRAAGETLDAAEIRRRAERFSPQRFRREIRAAVEELAGAPG
jgi:glycosyltransferase involved in cell wall biosynthesis